MDPGDGWPYQLLIRTAHDNYPPLHNLALFTAIRGKAVRVSVPVPSNTGFDRLLLARKQYAVAQAGQKTTHGLKTVRDLANVGRNLRNVG
jgi:hypothetical protein